MSISININTDYVLLTLIGIDFCRRLRLEYLTSPGSFCAHMTSELDPIVLLIWAFVAIFGLIFPLKLKIEINFSGKSH